MAPKGILLDYGGTLVEEVGFDTGAGNEALLKLAAYTPPNLTIEQVLERAQTISEQVAERRNEFGIETRHNRPSSIKAGAHNVAGLVPAQSRPNRERVRQSRP